MIGAESGRQKVQQTLLNIYYDVERYISSDLVRDFIHCVGLRCVKSALHTKTAVDCLSRSATCICIGKSAYVRNPDFHSYGSQATKNNRQFSLSPCARLFIALNFSSILRLYTFNWCVKCAFQFRCSFKCVLLQQIALHITWCLHFALSLSFARNDCISFVYSTVTGVLGLP